MLIDRPQITEGSAIINATVPSGTSLPASPNPGELFFLVVAGNDQKGTLQTYNGTVWVEAGIVALKTHEDRVDLHLSAAQNTLLDGLDLPTLKSAEVNFLKGVTAPIQEQLSATSGDFTAHINDNSRHLTAAQNTLIDGITATAAEVNYVVGANAPLQGQINTINTLNTTQNGRLTTLESTTVPAVQSNLTTHIADDTKHLTASQNILVDGITVPFADINKLAGAAGLTSSIKLTLDTLAGSDYSTKISANGSIGMSGNLSLGGNRVTNVAMPTSPNDAATKDYVDSFVQGMHWAGSVRLATTQNISLTGIQTIDGVALQVNDRVLVKNQTNAIENGIYLASSGDWSRANDYNSEVEINNSAVFVLQGSTQAKTTWVQTSTVTDLGASAISFSAFSGPVINSAGSGITLGTNGSVAVKEGAGIAFDGNGALIVDVYSGGGLMITTNNTSATTPTTTGASLALTQTGVTAGSYGSATQSPVFNVDTKGRITAADMVTITPAFASITALPSTLTGYGITDAVRKAGDTMTGNLSIVPTTGIAQFTITRATQATGQASLTLTTQSGTGAGSWQVYNQSNESALAFYSSIRGQDILRLTTAGNAQFTGDVTATGNITSNSDRRLKKDIQPILLPLEKVEKLNGVTFVLIDHNTKGTGLIAQDVQEVLPEAVREEDNGTLSVAYGNLAGLFVEAIKALNKQVAELQAEVRALKESK